jgi:hypothetical protein
MKVSENIKRLIGLDLAIGVFIATIAWNSLGTEGMAAKFCSSIHVDRCDEIDWSEEYAEGFAREDDPRGADEEIEVSQEKDKVPRKKIRLRSGS